MSDSRTLFRLLSVDFTVHRVNLNYTVNNTGVGVKTVRQIVSPLRRRPKLDAASDANVQQIFFPTTVSVPYQRS